MRRGGYKTDMEATWQHRRLNNTTRAVATNGEQKRRNPNYTNNQQNRRHPRSSRNRPQHIIVPETPNGIEKEHNGGV